MGTDIFGWKDTMQQQIDLDKAKSPDVLLGKLPEAIRPVRAKQTTRSTGGQLVKKDCTGHPDESDAAACTSRLVFPERKRRKNSSSGQDCARKIVRFSAIRSLFPPP